MNVPPEFRNFLTYLLQVALLITLGGLLRFAFRIRLPRVLLIYWQVLLILSLTIPLAAPRRMRTLPPAATPSIAQSVTDAIPMQSPAERRAPQVDWAHLFWQSLLPFLAVIGAARVGRLAVGLIRLRLVCSRARRFELPVSGFENIAPLRGDSDVLISADITGPATFGFMRSRILLPQQFENLDAESQVSILSHELIHVRRRDWVFGISEQLIAACFWFHPIVSWLVQRIELVREQVVDREVLELSVDRRQYLRSLLLMVAGPEAVLSANLFLSRHHLKERIAIFLENIDMSRKRLVASLISAVVLFVAGTVISTHAFPLTQTVVSVNQTVATKTVDAVHHPAEAAIPQTAPPVAKVVAGPVAAKKVVAVPPPAVGAEPQKTPDLSGQAKVVPVAPPSVTVPDNKPNMQISIAGFVIDPDGAPLPGVDIRVTDPETNDVLATAATDDQGTFRLSVPSAKESVDCAFRQEGFKPSVLKGIKTISNAPISVRVSMQIAAATCALSIKPGAEPTAFVSPINVSGRAMPAMIYWGKDLAYPPDALQQGLEGVVITEVKVDADGMISAVRLIKGDPHFDEAVMNAVRQWRCRPAYLNGKPHESLNTVTVKFSLK